MEIFIYLLLIVNVVLTFFLLFRKRKNFNRNFDDVIQQVNDVLNFQQRIEDNITQEFVTNRTENNNLAIATRTENTTNFNSFNQTIDTTLTRISQESRDQNREFNRVFQTHITENGNLNSQSRREYNSSFSTFTTTLDTKLDDKLDQLLLQHQNSMTNFSEIQKEKFDDLNKVVKDKLDEMKEVVDEKLQTTLERRLTESFKAVQTQLTNVHQGLGEMKQLAVDVGGLKKVLSNVKTRGAMGEVQLEQLLENALAPTQYIKNARTVPNSHNMVEFAIKLPGKNVDSSVLLPIDAKFPVDMYTNVVDAYEIGDKILIDKSIVELKNRIKSMAKDIQQKYINPPNTTDFAIMFLPFESIYAEVIRQSDLINVLQYKYNVIVTGPTTLYAILNSFQVGFRTLAIQKQSSHIADTLASVKNEFGKFNALLDKTRNNLRLADDNLDQLVGVRTRSIEKILSNITSLESLPVNTAEKTSNLHLKSFK